MKRKSSLFWAFFWYGLVCVLYIIAGILIFIVGKYHTGRGEITVYGINGIVAHYDDAEYERAKDMVIVHDGDTELRYINCNVEVKE